jgi:GGDEF domain-containing protein
MTGMTAALSSRRALTLLAVAVFALALVALSVFDRIGLGFGHFFYLAVALAALAGGAKAGGAAGLVAVGMLQLGVVLNPHLSVSPLAGFGTLVKASTFVVIGVLVGWFAESHRQMLAELKVLADRDTLTGLPNTRAFEAAINHRLAARNAFTLFIGELAAETVPDEAFRLVSEGMRRLLGPSDEIARVGDREFAILSQQRAERVGHLVARLEGVHLASSPGRLTFGWALFPSDGEDALALYRAATERLYARAVVRELDARQRDGLEPSPA